MGLEAETVLKVVAEPGVERVEKLKALAERLELEADSQIVGTIREGLEESWRVVCERGV
jgi:hypothetical protein